jgi:di/tricarboxylate transporter
VQYTPSHLNKKKKRVHDARPTMWKEPLTLFLVGVLVFLWRDLLNFFDRVAIRDVVVVLLVAATIGAVTLIRHMARRL